MLLEVLAISVALLLALVIYVATTIPKVVTISRSQMIHSSPEKLFPYINNPRLIQTWNSFTSGDPDVKIDYSGATDGVGAQWSWVGKKAGAGQATIIETEINKRVSLRLDFKRPFTVTNYGEYLLESKGAATEVTWTINETATIPRVLSRFMNLERMIGKVFESGLVTLKGLSEA